MKDKDNGKHFPDEFTKTEIEIKGHRIEFKASMVNQDHWTRILAFKDEDELYGHPLGENLIGIDFPIQKGKMDCINFLQQCDGKTIKTYINGKLVKTDKPRR